MKLAEVDTTKCLHNIGEKYVTSFPFRRFSGQLATRPAHCHKGDVMTNRGKFTVRKLGSVVTPKLGCGSGFGESLARGVIAGGITAACGPFAIVCGGATLIVMGAYCAS